MKSTTNRNPNGGQHFDVQNSTDSSEESPLQSLIPSHNESDGIHSPDLH